MSHCFSKSTITIILAVKLYVLLIPTKTTRKDKKCALCVTIVQVFSTFSLVYYMTFILIF